MQKYHIKPASIFLMKKLLDLIYISERNRRNLTYNGIADILNLSLKSVKNGIFMLKTLKILKNCINPILFSNIFNKLDKNYKVESLLFDKLKIFPLFNEYLNFINEGKTDYDAANLIKHLFNVNLSVESIKSTFNGWIKYFKLFDVLKKKEMQPKILFRKEINVILHIRRLFNDMICNIPTLVLNDLSEGIIQASIDPKNSLTDTGRALENYLRLTNSNSEELEKCNGIGQIANILRKKRVVNPKINNLLLALGSLRSIGDSHGLDKKENKIWEISEESALIYNFLTIKTIKSLENYKVGRLSF